MRREGVAWLTYVVSVVKRSYHWVALFLILGIILVMGLGMPVTLFDRFLSFWGHW